jgi:CRISPR/Cas system-associated endonuclease/helicase Cas3
MEARITNYIIAVNFGNKNALDTSMSECEEYLKKNSDRKAILLTGAPILNDSYKNLREINYKSVQTFKKGECRNVNFAGAENHSEALAKASFMLKNGLIILNDLELKADDLSLLLNNHQKNQDVIIHRQSLDLYEPELQYIRQELTEIAKNKAYRPLKRVTIRMHIDDNFNPTLETLNAYAAKFGELGKNLFLLQHVNHIKRVHLKRQIVEYCRSQNEDFNFFVDPYYYAKYTNNFIYFDVFSMRPRGQMDKEIIGKSISHLQKIMNE